MAAMPSHAGGLCQTYDVKEDWSETSNPNGPWSYREGGNPLPHVEAWQRIAGGWSEFQPGWAESEDDTNRLPFWFQSNGKATFERDFLAGDIVVHTWDASNGQGNGQAELVWTSPFDGVISITGSTWMGRDIGRAINWSLLHEDTVLTTGSISSGDIYSRGAPFHFAAGSGGAGVLENIEVAAGDEIRLRMETASSSGDFAGVRMEVVCQSVGSTSTTTTTLPGACGDPLLVYRDDVAGDEGSAADSEGVGATINASDALYVLRSAVGSATCDLCVCDVNASSSITATDALIVLRKGVGQDVPLTCPPCGD
ncbi:MAG TPA: hypothetical protein VEC57_06840 [Candidatus Limnocylindrales bacterium]|nr:hypothetical protein [Candidatus Limnocylindrales bacterium]